MAEVAKEFYLQSSPPPSNGTFTGVVSSSALLLLALHPPSPSSLFFFFFQQSQLWSVKRWWRVCAVNSCCLRFLGKAKEVVLLSFVAPFRFPPSTPRGGGEGVEMLASFGVSNAFDGRYNYATIISASCPRLLFLWPCLCSPAFRVFDLPRVSQEFIYSEARNYSHR